MKYVSLATVLLGALGVHVACYAVVEAHDFALASIGADGVELDAARDAQPDATRPAPAPAPMQALPASGNPLWAIPVSKLSATRDRPLFSMSRRPPTPTVAGAPAPAAAGAALAPDTPPFGLVGTIIGEHNRIAIFLDDASKMAIGVKEGERASGWTLRAVDPRSTVVESSGRTVTLGLPEPTGQDGTAPAPVGAEPSPVRPPKTSRFMPKDANGL